jgi:hypothetical protein
MATYSITAPNGRVYRINGPEGASRQQVISALMLRYPELSGSPEKPEAPPAPEPSTDRSWGDVVGDVGAGLVRGTGELVQLPGQLYGLATGDFAPTGFLGAGQRLAAKGEGMESAGLQERRRQHEAQVQAAEEGGQMAAFKEAFLGTVKDPALLSNFLSTQIPQLVPILLTGGAAAAAQAGRVTAQQLARGATKEVAQEAAQAAATKAGTTAAIHTGATMQGASVGEQTYDDIFNHELERTGDAQAAASAALSRARAAGVAGYGLSILANRYMPGGEALERALVSRGTGAGMLRGAATGAVREVPSEVTEEVGGQMASNVAVGQVDKSRSLWDGTGQTAGMAAIGGLGLGAGVGAYQGRGAPPAPDVAPAPALDEAPPEAPPEAPAPVPPQSELPSYEDLTLLRERLRNEPESKERNEALKKVDETLKASGRLHAQAAIDRRKQATAAAEAGAQQSRWDAEMAQARGMPSAQDSALAQAQPDLFGEVRPEPPAAPPPPADPVIMHDPEGRQMDLLGPGRGDESAFVQSDPDLFGMYYPPAAEPAPVDTPEPEAAPVPRGQRRLGLRGGSTQASPVPEAQAQPTTDAGIDVEAPLTRAELEQAGAPLEWEGVSRMDLMMQVAERPALAQAPGVQQLLGGSNGPIRSEPDAPGQPGIPGVGAPGRRAPKPRAADAAGAGAPGRGRVGGVPAEPGVQQSVAGASPSPLSELQAARTKPEFDAAMDLFVQIQRDPAHPRHGETEQILGQYQNAPEFQRALQAAELRNRAPQSAPPREAPTDVVDGEIDLVGRAAQAQQPQTELFDLPSGYHADTQRDQERRQQDDLAANRKEAWAGVPDVQRSKKAQQSLKFSKTGGTPPAKPMSREALDAIYDRVTRAVGADRGNVRVLDSVSEVDATQKPGSVSGGMGGDTVYLFRDGIADGVEGQKTILHELLHRGLERLFPAEQLQRELGKLYTQSAQVREMADAWLASDIGRESTAGMPRAQGQTLAVNEALAEFSETQPLPGTLRQIGNMLARLADLLGMPQLATNIRNMGLSPLQQFVRDALQALPSQAPTKTKQPTVARKVPAAPTNDSRSVDKALAALKMQPAPPVPATRKLAAAYQNAVDNPQGTAQSMRKAATTWVDRIGNAVFSSNFAFNSEVRRQIKADTDLNAEKMGRLLSISDSQVDGAGVLAGIFAQMGNLEYDPKLYKWKGKAADASMEGIARSVSRMAAQHGLDPAKASRAVHAYFEARRTEVLQERNDALGPVVEQLRAIGAEAQAKVMEKRMVTGLRDKAWVEQALQLDRTLPELKQIAAQWNKVRENTSKVMVDSGLWTPDMAEDMLSAAEYVPFYREEQLAEGQGPREFITGLQVKAKEHRLKGSDAEVNDIFDNMMRWTQYAIERSVRNHMAVQRIDVALELGMGKHITAEDTPRLSNPVRVWRDGRQELYEMADPLFMDSFKGLESIALPALQGLAKVTNVFRQAVVLNPLFGALQVPQDAVAAMFTSGLKPRHAFTIPARAVNQFVRTLINPEGNATHQYLRSLGAVGVRDTTADVLRADLEMLEGARRDVSLPAAAWRSLNKALHHIAMASDSAVRQATYNAAMDAGVSQAEAVEKAFQVINFRNRGTSKMLAAASRMIPFMNAYMAAQHVAYKTLSGRGGTSPAERSAALQTLAATSLGLLGLSMVYAMVNGGDEGYEKRPTYVRDRVFVVPGTGGFSIPIRSDVFALPKVVGEHLWHHITDSGTLDGANTRRSITDLLVNSIMAPGTVPQAAKPLAEISLNYDMFRQRPIVGATLAGAETEQQYTDSTSELGKLVGQSGLISPANFDHLLRGYLGSLGGAVMYASNAVAMVGGDVPRPSMSMWDAIASFPGASTLLPRQSDTALRSDFYELKEATDRVASTVSVLSGRNPQDLDAYMNDETMVMRYALSKEVSKINRTLGEMRKEIRMIAAAPDMSASEKREAIQAIREAEVELLRGLDLKELRKLAKL